MRLLDLAQGSPAWHDWRRRGVGSSAAPVVAGLAPRSWGLTRLRLWEEMTGRRVADRPGPAMRRGTNLEPLLRDWYARTTGAAVRPACVQHDGRDWLRASLDALHAGGDCFVEIKYANADVHAAALAGEVAPHHYAQMQHQLLATGLPECRYLTHNDQSFRGRDQYALLTVVADPAYQGWLLDLEAAFWRHVCAGTPPAPWHVGWYRARGVRTWEEVSRSLDEGEAFRLLLAESLRRRDKSSECVVLPEDKHPFRKAERVTGTTGGAITGGKGK